MQSAFTKSVAKQIQVNDQLYELSYPQDVNEYKSETKKHSHVTKKHSHETKKRSHDVKRRSHDLKRLSNDVKRLSNDVKMRHLDHKDKPEVVLRRKKNRPMSLLQTTRGSKLLAVGLP